MDKIKIERTWLQGSPVQVDNLMGNAFVGEAGAHEFLISGKDNAGNVVPITGSISGKFLSSTMTTFALSGYVTEGVASVTLPSECYGAPGQFVVSIFATNGSTTTCIYCGVGSIFRTSTAAIAYPTTTLPDLTLLINQLDDVIASFPADLTHLLGAIAPTFVDNQPFTAGQYVWYNQVIYRFTADHPAGSWAGSADTVVAVIGTELNSTIRYTQQVLTDAQKTVARSNIAAANAELEDKIGTVPSGTTVENQIFSQGTQISTNASNIDALQRQVGTVPTGETVEGQIGDLKSAIDAMEGPATSADEGKSLLVKTVSGGKVTAWEYGEAITLDDTLTQEGQAADAKAVGDAIERNVLVSETPTMEDGKYINASGNIGSNSGFALSNYIEVDGVYAIYSALAKDYAIYYFTESKEKISLQNVDNATFQAKMVVLEIPENAYYFRFNDYKATLPVASCCVYKSLPDENKNNIINLNSKIDKVDDRFYDLGLIESVDFSDRETGFYLNQNCAKISYNGAFISQPVSVKAGDTIELYIASYTNMSVISKYNNGTYTPLVIGQYTDYNNAYSYTYTSTEDCDLVFSGYDRNGYYANIVTHIADTVDSLETEIEVIKNENRRNAEVEPLEIGYYINSSGSKVPLGTATRGGVITSPIYLEKGETLTIYAMSYSIMSAIALISGTGYLPAVLGDSTYEEVYKQYTYTAPFDCSVVVSGYSQLPPYGYITKQYSVSNNPFSNLLVGAGLASAYDTMGFIGDSISSGECYSNEGGTNVAHDIYAVSWGQYLAKMCGATGYNWSRGGQTSKTWIAEWSNNASFTDHPCKMYVIGLGQNDGYDLTDPRTVPLGVPADVGTDAETFYGLYSKIILRVKEIQPKAHIFVITNIIQQIEDHGYNTAIRYMASYYDNVFLLDYYTYGQELLNSPLMLSQKRLGHYTALGYRLMAQYINSYIDWYIRNNPAKFSQIEFIGTEWSWT